MLLERSTRSAIIPEQFHDLRKGLQGRSAPETKREQERRAMKGTIRKGEK
jgi:hypothetical protein